MVGKAYKFTFKQKKRCKIWCSGEGDMLNFLRGVKIGLQSLFSDNFVIKYDLIGRETEVVPYMVGKAYKFTFKQKIRRMIWCSGEGDMLVFLRGVKTRLHSLFSDNFAFKSDLIGRETKVMSYMIGKAYKSTFK